MQQLPCVVCLLSLCLPAIAVPDVDPDGLVLLQRGAEFVDRSTRNESEESEGLLRGEGSSVENSTDMHPRMLVMGGCSGSSFVTGVAQKMLEHFGTPVVYFGDAEMLKPHKNRFYKKKTGMGPAMVEARDFAREHNGVLVFQAMANQLTRPEEKTEPGLRWREMVPSFTSMGTRTVFVYRKNLLDLAVCNVRDCFHKEFGSPVDAQGKKSKLCFDRRSTKGGEEIKAKFDDGKVAEAIEYFHEDRMNAFNILKKDFAFKTIVKEDLVAYQWGNPHGLLIAVKAWKQFMQSWGVEASEKEIEKFLVENTEQRDMPGPHADSIYNIDDVKKQLQEAKLTRYLRD